MKESRHNITISLEEDCLGSSYGINYRNAEEAISLPLDEKFAHVNMRTSEVNLTFIVNNAGAARKLADMLMAAADRVEKNGSL